MTTKVQAMKNNNRLDSIKIKQCALEDTMNKVKKTIHRVRETIYLIWHLYLDYVNNNQRTKRVHK